MDMEVRRGRCHRGSVRSAPPHSWGRAALSAYATALSDRHHGRVWAAATLAVGVESAVQMRPTGVAIDAGPLRGAALAGHVVSWGARRGGGRVKEEGSKVRRLKGGEGEVLQDRRDMPMPLTWSMLTA